MKHKCSICNTSFTRKFNLKHHVASKHSGVKNISSCFLCGKAFDNFSSLTTHFKNSHKPRDYFYVKESAFQQKAIIYRYVYDNNVISTALEAQSDFIKKEIR